MIRIENVPAEFVDIGFRLHLIVLGAIVAALVVATILTTVALARSKKRDPEGLAFSAGTFGIATLIMGVIWLIVLIPFDGTYHHLYRVEGRIESVSNVLSEASGDLTRTPVVELSTVDRPIEVSDPRVVSLEGQDVVLTCKVGWHYQAADTYSCEIHTIVPEEAG